MLCVCMQSSVGVDLMWQAALNSSHTASLHLQRELNTEVQVQRLNQRQLFEEFRFTCKTSLKETQSTLFVVVLCTRHKTLVLTKLWLLESKCLTLFKKSCTAVSHTMTSAVKKNRCIFFFLLLTCTVQQWYLNISCINNSFQWLFLCQHNTYIAVWFVLILCATAILEDVSFRNKILKYTW